MSLRVLQLNTNRSTRSHDMAVKIATKRRADLILLSEPNKGACGDGVYEADTERDAAIRVISKSTPKKSCGRGLGHTWIETCGIALYSVYISPSISEEECGRILDDISTNINSRGHRKAIVAGDFNAKSITWGSRRTNSRGNNVLNWAASLNLHCLNDGVTPTFERNNSISFIDLTFVTDSLANSIRSWSVLPDITLSDHHCIELVIGLKDAAARAGPKQVGWLYKPQDAEALRACLEVRLGELQDPGPADLTAAIQESCRDVLKPKMTGGLPPVPWWTAEVAELHDLCVAARRVVTRERRTGPPKKAASRRGADCGSYCAEP